MTIGKKKLSNAARAGVAAIGSAALAAALLYAGRYRRIDHAVSKKHPEGAPKPESD